MVKKRADYFVVEISKTESDKSQISRSFSLYKGKQSFHYRKLGCVIKLVNQFSEIFFLVGHQRQDVPELR